MSLAEEIAFALGSPKKTPEGYMCKCPCHDDKTASLSLTVTDKGLILNCFADCKWEDVKKEIERRGLLKKNSSRSHHTAKAGKSGASYQRKEPYSKYPEGTKFYEYRDIVGNLLARKVKTPQKAMWVERFEKDKWVSGLNGLKLPLYRLPEVLEADIIYLTEGEKDAETIIAADLPKSFATTNHAGASSWGEHYTDQLKGKIVVLPPDNDAAGKKRIATLTKALSGVAREIRVFVPDNVPFHGDITDWVENGGDLTTVFERSTVVTPKAKQKAPTREDYLGIIEGYFGPLRRDIFSHDLVYLDKWSNRWQPAVNKIAALRSEVRELAVNSDKKLKASEIEDHLIHLETNSTPQFVIEIPEWDGRDRLLELAQRVVLSDKQVAIGVNESVFCDLLKNWHSKMWMRLEDPTVRNEIFILAGEQNIGKDFWIRENCDALGQFLINFSIHSNERDTKEQLHRGLVMNISEFDRNSRAEVSLLKEIVTTPRTELRFAYDRRAQSRDCRCSFIASTNVNDIFNDPTGHSRYVFFELKYIDKSARFSDSDKLQVLAQGRALAESGFVAQESSLAVMRSQIVELTPDDEYQLIVDRWDYLATEIFNNLDHFDKERFSTTDDKDDFSGFLPNDCTFETITRIAKEFDKSVKKVRSTLKLKGRQRVHKKFGRGFYYILTSSSRTHQDFPF